MINPYIGMKFNNKEEELKAVSCTGRTIQYIHNPDKEVQLAAIRCDPKAIEYIVDIDPAALTEYEV